MGVYYSIYKLGLMRHLLISNGFMPTDTLYAVLMVASVAVCIVSGYFLGGLNFAIIVSKKKYGVDVRDFGSGNAGMTNMRRTFGKKAGHITLIGDAVKAIVACIIGYLLLGLFGAYIAGFFSVVGHMFPAKYKFKGGKGVVCTAVVVLMTTAGNPTFYYIPVVFLILIAAFAIIVLGSRFISLGSIIAVLLYPLVLNAFQNLGMDADKLIKLFEEDEQALYTYSLLHAEDGFYIVIAFAITVLVVFMHRENIKRLLNKEESKFEFHMSGKKTLYEQKLDDDAEAAAVADSAKSLADKPNPNTSKKKKSRK